MLNHKLALPITAGAVALILSGCAGPSMKDLAEDRAEADAVAADAAEERRDRQQEVNEEYLGAVPNWALEPPTQDPNFIYAVGMADSGKMALALRQAKLVGDFNLAQEIKQELSGMEKQYASETNTGTAQSQYTLVIDRFVERVNLQGQEVVHQEVVPIDGRFHAFTLVRMPMDALIAAAAEAEGQQVQDSAQAAYDELQKRLEHRRAQRLEEEQASGAQVSAAATTSDAQSL
ncbi:hypothetical protein [Halomonas sp. I5-271120]|uniref:hypothetical protein n=1 Tax=Halomonas sp. I5-271120 TaxID=3061632 RepID=UPI002714CC1B|nr:hypothetical protein [Halomonas sp. I5-271120]